MAAPPPRTASGTLSPSNPPSFSFPFSFPFPLCRAAEGDFYAPAPPGQPGFAAKGRAFYPLQGGCFPAPHSLFARKENGPLERSKRERARGIEAHRPTRSRKGPWTPLCSVRALSASRWGCRGRSLASGGQKCFWAPAIFLWYRQAAPSRAAKPPRPIWAAPQVRRRRREPVCQATGVYQIKGAPAALCAVGKKKEMVGPKALPFGEEKMRPFGRKEKPGPLCGEKRGSRPFGRRIKKAPGGALFLCFTAGR